MRLRDTLSRPYLFVHVNKCGGTSVANALGMMRVHCTVQDWIMHLGRDYFVSRKSFSIVRRPYERLCSLYRYRAKRGVAVSDGRPLDLNEWIYRTVHLKDPGLIRQPKMLAPASEWMLDAEGNQLVQLVVRLEDIETDWSRIQELTGCPAPLPHKNPTVETAENSVSALSHESREIIEDNFAADFEAFGYSMI